MTQEDKELLWIDCFARIPYGVKFRFEVDKGIYHTECFLSKDGLPSFDGLWVYWAGEGYLKPYLRPMSSMIREEKDELNSISHEFSFEWFDAKTTEERYIANAKMQSRSIDFYHANHFDYRGLIEKGLALEAPKGMYSKN